MLLPTIGFEVETCGWRIPKLGRFRAVFVGSDFSVTIGPPADVASWPAQNNSMMHVIDEHLLDLAGDGVLSSANNPSDRK
jgi:hypothetical protein